MIDWSKFKAFADDNLNVAKTAKFCICWREKKLSAGKGKYAGYQHFLLFPQSFSAASLLLEKPLAALAIRTVGSLFSSPVP